MTAAAGVVVVAHWHTAPATLADVLGYAAEVRTPSLAEPGCLGYDILQDAADPTHVVLIEQYRDRGALDAHLQSAHYQQWVVGHIRPLLTGRTVEILQPHPTSDR